MTVLGSAIDGVITPFDIFFVVGMDDRESTDGMLGWGVTSVVGNAPSLDFVTKQRKVF